MNFSSTRDIKTLLQIGTAVSALIPILFLLCIGLLVSKELTGTNAIFALFFVSGSIIVVFLGMFAINAFIQRRIDALFRETSAVCHAHAEGKLTDRLVIYGDDSFSLLRKSLNVLFESRSLRQKETSSEQARRRMRAFDARIDEERVDSEHERRDTYGKANSSLRIVEKTPKDNPFLHEDGSLSLETMHQAATQLSRAAHNIVDRSAFQEQASRAQAIQIFQTTEKIEELATSIHQIARNAQGSASLAQAGLVRVHKSQEALHHTIEGMASLQKQTQRAAQKVYRVGEQSTAIGNIVQIIEQLSAQISQLTHHPVLQKAQAENLGPEFTSIAEQIHALATHAAESATQVVTLAATIETETREAVVALQDSSRDVAARAQRAEEAGKALHDLYHTMEFQAGMVEDIAQAALEQTSVVDTAASAMSQIAKMAYQSSKETQQSVQGLKRLASMSEQLHLSTTEALSSETDTSESLSPPGSDNTTWGQIAQHRKRPL